MQRRDRLIAAVLIVLVFVASAIAYGASVNDPAWEKIVGAGKKEAKVVVFGPPGADVRDAYTIGFQKKYPEIEVDFNGMQGAQVAPKLMTELKAQQYRTDLVVAGTTTALEGLAPSVRRSTTAPVEVVPALDDVAPAVARIVRPGDVVITLGAGSIGTVPDRLLDLLTRGRDHEGQPRSDPASVRKEGA